ncbi:MULTISPECIES: hypothetical protein [Rhizobium]|uniref:hypothetical protein n=1 Tax=Rhizobium TaxID=379 RepID=UPI001146893C|nr:MULTISPECIES: hypothetical protein [Rhizobium]MCA0800419.1 hypothetical protein [Rhizobium sp. T1473]MCS0461579.1 hypothetical protein [Rhizobium favelukesii]UFS82119.1 hypothetical protein LPB79_28195 [Rhizobium sp. T136]
MTGRAAAYTDEGRQSQLSPGISEFAAAIQDLASLINVCDDVLTRRVRNIFLRSQPPRAFLRQSSVSGAKKETVTSKYR